MNKEIIDRIEHIEEVLEIIIKDYYEGTFRDCMLESIGVKL